MHDFLLAKGRILSTDDAGRGEHLAYWTDLVCDEFIQLDCRCEQQAVFNGAIRGCRIDALHISQVNADPQHVVRARHQIAKSTESEFLLSLQLEDVGIVNQDGRMAALHPGDFALYDSTRPYTLHFARPFRQIVLQIPYDALAELFIKPQTITARRISAQSGVGAVTSQFIQSVAARLDTLAPQDRRVVTEHIIELIALSMGSTSALREVDGQSIARTAMLERLQQYIALNIRNPLLSPSLIAGQHRISERYQRMLFASIGTTVSRYVLERRLELCRAALEDSALVDYNLTQLAFSFGFNDAAHFSRKFKEKYKISPRAYRERSLAG